VGADEFGKGMLITGQAGLQGLRDGVSAAADAARGTIGLAGCVATVEYVECGRTGPARGGSSSSRDVTAGEEAGTAASAWVMLISPVHGRG
jgi:hypothetical protein